MFGRKIKLKSARDFCRRFGIGLKAGADLLKLLESESQHGPPRQRAAIKELKQRASGGSSLADGMAASKGFFPSLMITMTRVGESTGRLERTLLSLSDHYDQQVVLRQNFLRAITWPAIQLIAAIGVISLLIMLMGMLTPATGGEMTDILGFGLRGTSGVLVFWAYIAAVSAAIAATIWAYRSNLGGVQNIVPLIYRIPVIGDAIQTITLSRFTWTLALGLETGLNPIPAIELALDATDSDYYRSGAADSEKAIRAGRSLAGALEETHLFPHELIMQVEVAEMSGTDAESINHLAEDYDRRAQSAIQTISGVATGLIWLSTAGVLIFLIVRLVMNIAGVYSSALEPI